MTVLFHRAQNGVNHLLIDHVDKAAVRDCIGRDRSKADEAEEHERDCNFRPHLMCNLIERLFLFCQLIEREIAEQTADRIGNLCCNLAAADNNLTAAKLGAAVDSQRHIFKAVTQHDDIVVVMTD